MSFDAKRTLEELAGRVSNGYEMDRIAIRAKQLARRRWLLRVVSVVPAVLLIVGSSTLLLGERVSDQGESRNEAVQAGRSPSVTSSPTPTRSCGWVAIRPYLMSLLISVGGPEDATLNAKTLSPTQNGIRLHPAAYEGRWDVYVTADNEPDPQNAISNGMEIAARHSGFTVYRSENQQGDVVLAVDDNTEWTMSLVAYPFDGSLIWTDRSSPVEWMKKAIDYSHESPPPEC